MSIDERLEALTQSVELLSHMGQATDRRIEEMGQATDRRINQLASLIQQDAENIRALARIAEAHEHRIGDIEEGRN